MPCDSRPFQKNQTLSERKTQVLEAVVKLNGLLASGRVKPKVGPQGAIVFDGWSTQDRYGVTDACAYRRVMAIGGSLAKAAIAKAEALAGRTVNKQAVGVGVHSHDGGLSWHDHKG